MKVIGITSGIGSLQYGFYKEGFKIGHAHEWRQYYNDGAHTLNYDAPVFEHYEVQPEDIGVEVITSHPECGNFSNLYTGPNRDTRTKDPGDIHKFTELANEYKPLVFLVDNLPKSLEAVHRL